VVTLLSTASAAEIAARLNRDSYPVASKYDDLDAHRELEQQIAEDLRAAFGPRGCVVLHHGSQSGGLHSPAGKPDIELQDPVNRRLVLVEVTKRQSTAAEGEFLAITNHLQRAIDKGGYSDYGLLYISPRTSPRMSTSIRDLFNRGRERDGQPGRIVGLDFAALQLALERLIESDPQLYPASRLGVLFEHWAEAIDDARARQLVQASLFPDDYKLSLELANEASELDAEREKRLKTQLLRIEDKLRDYGVTGNEANTALVHLAFIRLYEERRQRELGEQNRFTVEGFTAWRQEQPAAIQNRYRGKMVEALLHEIAEDPALRAAGLLRDHLGEKTRLHREITDKVLDELILPILDQYDFHAGRVDVLGAVFETLARRSEKDTRVGQFFTPQQVVDFCADIVRLKPSDRVLDPAVGTARFLIAAMERMLANADDAVEERATTESSIRERQLLGADIDDWVSTIAKMNMFIHGDGKTNIQTQNGLVLGDTGRFPSIPKGLWGEIDVVLTNPPLGDTSYLVAADAWARSDPPDRDGRRIEFLEGLGVVPLRTVEADEAERWRERLETSNAQIAELEALAPEVRPVQKLRTAYRTRNNRSLRLQELERALAQGDVTRVPAGETMKGGALFLGATAHYLRAVRDPQAGIEWRGGQAALIVDEAILNTPGYGRVRSFIRDHFYVKAVISLERDAFKYLAHTDAKTSVLYLIKKPHLNVRQREPIFFAHADRVGYSATGSWVGDDLPQILLEYRLFESAVEGAYRGAAFDQGACRIAIEQLPGFAHAFFSRFDDGAGSGRLDYYAARYIQRERELRDRYENVPTLADILEEVDYERPEPSRTGEYEFAVVTRQGTVESKGLAEVDYAPADLWVVRDKQLIVSGIDLIKGAAGVAREDTDGMVMSKEMYAYRVKPGVGAVPDYLQMLLRTATAREMLIGLTTGTSNRTRLERGEQLLSLPIPPLPSLPEQRAQAQAIRDAYALRRDAAARLQSAQDAAEAGWGRDSYPAPPDPRQLPVVDGELV
jgi:hypothetical protein